MSTPGERVLHRVLLGLAVPLAALVLFTGWGRWPDVLIDFGRELYVPWRLTEGEVLVRDLSWFNGPLSPYLNALWFELFGVGFWTMAWANIALLGVFCIVFYRYLAAISTRVAGAAALLFFLAVFAGGQQVPGGNYNFISPYSHEATHGLLFGLASLACARRAERGRSRWFALVGFFLGLVFLTKVEMFVAAGGGVLATFFIRSRIGAHAGRTGLLSLRDAGAFAVAALIPVLVAFGALATAMPIGDAFLATLGSWGNVFESGVSDLAYYRHGMGFDAPGQNIGLVVKSFAIMAAAFAPGLVVGRIVGRPGSTGVVVIALVFAASLAGWLVAPTSWRWFARGLPLALLLTTGVGFVLGRRLRDDDERERWAAFLGFAAFAFLLLGKMLIQVRFGHYGFALAAPAACAILVLVVGWIPRFVRGLGASTGPCFIACALGVYAACGADLWRKSATFFARKTVEVGTGRDRILADQRGLYVNAALDELDARLEDGDEVLVLPEGVTINYFARRRTPTPYFNFMPPELILFGEDAMVAALEKRPPAAVVLAHKNTAEYGYPFFGTDYGTVLSRWVLDHFEHVWTDPRGGFPLQPDTLFGISILAAK